MAKRPAHARPPARPLRFAWSLDGRGGFVEAFTRSHARALVKRQLGIPTSRRLPSQFQLERVA
jgi:hypothetical protein